MTFDPKFTRFPFFPLAYDKRRMAVANEIMIDYLEYEMYIRNSDNTKNILIASSKAMGHLVDYNNPHNVTKNQIGLGMVDDVKQASFSDFKEHIDAINPHGISKDTIELGNVENYKLATVEDVLNGRPDRYVTPAILHHAIERYGINIGSKFALIINTTPSFNVKVEVFVDDKWLEGNSFLLPVNNYRVRASREGYSTYEELIVLDSDKVIDINLETIKYKVEFEVDQVGPTLKIEVLIDGEWVTVGIDDKGEMFIHEED